MRNKTLIVILVLLVTTIIVTAVIAVLLIQDEESPETTEIETTSEIKEVDYSTYTKYTPQECYHIDSIKDIDLKEFDENDFEYYGYQPVYMYTQNANETCTPQLNKVFKNKSGVHIYMTNGMGTQLYDVILQQSQDCIYVKKRGSVYFEGFPGILYGAIGDGADYRAIEEGLINAGLTTKVYKLVSFDDSSATVVASDGEEHTIQY